MSKHRAEVRPRYGRLAALGAALGVTLVAVLGGTGLLPTAAGDDPEPVVATASVDDALPSSAGSPSAATTPSTGTSARTLTGSDPTGGSSGDPSLGSLEAPDDVPLPPGSGTGKRIVFSEGQQRVWLVSGGHHVERTYLVSGSLYDNLDPGTYSVYSRSEQAWGIDDSGTMKYFVRFTQGDNAAIGFHDIPVADGHRVQTVAQLGTPQSHGCIRQKRSDAIALWNFAPIGTTVVVTG